MKVYCVNLKRSPERRLAMAAEFAKFGIVHEFIDAVDGYLLSDDELNLSYSLWRTMLRRGYGLNRGEIGCALSHVGLYQRIVADSEPAIIFEDDITFCDGINEDLAQIIDFLDHEPGPTLVKMSGWPGGNSESGKFISSDYLTGTYAYGVNVEAAKLLLSVHSPIKSPIDYYWYVVKYFNLRLFSYDKTVVRLIDDSVSTIGDNRFASVASHVGFKVWRILGCAIDHMLTQFEKKAKKFPVYIYEGIGNTQYTHNANAYQKPRLVADNLQGVLLAKGNVSDRCWEEFLYAVRDSIPNGRTPIYCLNPSREVDFLRTLFRHLILQHKIVLFCWDPPGIYWRDRHDMLARIRMWVLSKLQSIAIMCSVCTVFNLHRGFAERYLWKCAIKKCVFFPNGTCVADNRMAAGGVEHIPHRIAISNAFMRSKGCFWLADCLVEVKRQIPDLSVVWVGADHGDLQTVRAKLLAGGFESSDLLHLGPAKHTEALRLWASADIGFNAYPDQPSVKWNHVLKIPEFMSLGLPVVSVDLPGTHGYIAQGVGRLFAPNDMEDAVRALVTILSDGERINAGRSATLEYVKQYDWDCVNRNIADVIRNIIEGGRK